MSRSSFPLALTLAAIAACQDVSAPDLATPSLKSESGGTIEVAEIHPLRQGSTATPLTALSTSAWIVKGRGQSMEIEYTDPDGLADVDPTIMLDYVRLDFANGTLLNRPDGSALADGDSVLVTLTVDPLVFRLTLEPNGLTFDAGNPAKLRVRYHRADPDFNEDGVVDAADETLRTTRLAVWLQDDATGRWSTIPAQHALVSRKFDAPLEHFSNYAISW